MISGAAFSGRVEELQWLFQALGRAVNGEPQVVWVEGGPGVGKSALLRAFGVRAAQRQNRSYVFHVRPPAEGGYRPVTLAAVEATNKQLYDRIGGRRKAFESARELLPDWLGALPVAGDLIAAIVATGQVLRRRSRERGGTPGITMTEDVEALLDVAARRPLVLLFDDLDQVDAAGVTELERLIRSAAGGMKLLVVAAVQSAPAGSPTPPIFQLVNTLATRSGQRRRLQELAPRELEAWINNRFPHVTIPASFLTWLYDQTGGHPAAVQTTFDRLVERSAIRFVDRGWEITDHAVEIQTPIAAHLPIELSRISPQVADVLQAASAIGDEFDGSTVALMMERDELYVEDQLAHAVHQKLVQVIGETTSHDGDIATEYRFTSSHLRASLARMVPARERGSLHGSQQASPSRP
jgi:predicted ATPase